MKSWLSIRKASRNMEGLCYTCNIDTALCVRTDYSVISVPTPSLVNISSSSA